MKLVRLSCDFLFGVLLIGGVPWCVIMALILILASLYESLFHVIMSEGTRGVFVGLMSIAAVAVIVYAIRFRLRRRLLPKGVVVLEVLLGVGAFLLFSPFGLFLFYAIAHWLR